MRLRYHSDDINTLDINRLTFKFLLRHRSCKANSNRRQNVSEEGEEATTVEPSVDMSEEIEGNDDVIMEDGEQIPNVDYMYNDYNDYALIEEDGDGDHNYAHDLNRQQIIERKPDEEFYEIVNSWEGKALTAELDGRIMTQEGIIGDKNRRWFKSNGFLVAQNGKVLQDNGPCQWVTLEHADPADPRQKWTTRIDDTDFNHEIISGNGNYLDIIKDPQTSDTLRIGTNTQRRKGIKNESGLWKFNHLGDFEGIQHLGELEEEKDDPMVCQIEE